MLRSAVNSAPATTAAVSTRRMPSPSDTLLSTSASSRSDQPPSGPTSTTGSRERRRARRRARPARRRKPASVRGPRRGSGLAPISGRKGRRDCIAASRTILRSRPSRRMAASGSGRTTVRSATSGVRTSTPELDQLGDRPFGPLRLGPREADLEHRQRAFACGGPGRRLRARSRLPCRERPATGPRGAAASEVNPQSLQEPVPSAAATVSPGLRRRTSPRWRASSSLSSGASRSSTKTSAAAARSSVSGAQAATLSRKRSGAGRAGLGRAVGPAHRGGPRACAAARPPPSRA